MKKKLLYRVPNSIKTFGLLFCLFVAKDSFSQSDGDLRSRSNNAGYGTANTWQIYSSATGAWTTSTVIPTATTNVLIRDGYTQTSNGSGYVAGTLTIGEGNAATGTATISGGAITAVTITNPGKLNTISSGVTFIGPATTLAAATIDSVNVTGSSFNDQGSGYTTATVTFAIAPAGGTTATGTAVISGGKITGITITDPGSGYTAIPTITITGDGIGAIYTTQVGIQSVTITSGGSGYTNAPTVTFGTAFLVGNATTTRSVTVSGDVTFNNGASSRTGGTTSSLTSTLVIGGNLIAATPISFITQVPTSVSSTTVNFTKNGTATITGPSFLFRNITFGANTIVTPPTDLNVAGNITKSTGPTTINCGIDASNSTVNLNTYPTPTTPLLSDSAFLNGLVKNLNMNNTAGVRLSQTLSITNSWVQQAGIFTIRPGKTVTIPSPTAITGTYGSSNFIATDTSKITGLMGALQIQNITSSTIFPVGQGGNYLPVTLTPSNTSTFTVSVFTGATDDGTPNGTPTADKSNLVDAIYTITRTSGTGNCTVTLGFPAALKGSGFIGINNNQLGVAHYNGATWDAVTGTGDNTENFATGTFSTFSPFRVEVNLGGPLPVTFGDIKVAKVNNQSKITWNIYTEQNTDKYIVERSTDGRSFTSIGLVYANGSSSYSIVDTSPIFGINLYRIKVVNRDNTISYSKVVLVNYNNLTNSVSVSPNPVTSGFFTITFSHLKAGKVTVKLFSNNGQLVMDQPIDYNGSTDNQLINVPSNISKGIYQLVITDGSNSQRTSVIIQ